MTNSNPDLQNYEKLRLIRRGSSGEVYEVKDKRKVAFMQQKSIFYGTDSSSTETYKQKNEIDIISKLNFPSIIRQITVSQRDFTNKNKPVIITEYYPNGTLDQLLSLSGKNKPPLEWTDTKKLIIIFGIASAMKYLHSQNIIHGNLKPSNILLDANYYPKIFDFYNSIDEKNSSKFPISSNNQSPIYTAPEFYLENEITKSGDVFSFGMIVYEIISNKKPFLNEQPFMIQQKIANGERPDFNEKINDSFKELIESCWCDNPSERLSFESIVTQLKENDGFCEKSINREEFNKYTDSFILKRKKINPNKFKPDIKPVEVSISEKSPQSPKDRKTIESPKDKPKIESPKDKPKIESPKNKPKIESPKDRKKIESPKNKPKIESPKDKPKIESPKDKPKIESPKDKPKIESPKDKPKIESPKNKPKIESPKGRIKRESSKDKIETESSSSSSSTYEEELNELDEEEEESILYKKNMDQKIQRLKRQAKNGNTQSMIELGNIYSDETDENYYNDKKAAKYFFKAATNLIRDQRRKEEAKKYYRKSAHLGDVDAMIKYAKIVNDDNPTKAVKYYKMAYEKGNSYAAFKYGLMLEHGNGIAVNKKEAAKMYKIAADDGIISAIHNYARVLEHGIGITQDVDEALKYLKRAKKLNDPKGTKMYNWLVKNRDKLENDAVDDSESDIDSDDDDDDDDDNDDDDFD